MYEDDFLRFTNAEAPESCYLFRFPLFRPNLAIYPTFGAKIKSYSSFRFAFQLNFRIEAKDDQYQANQWFVDLLSHRYFLQNPDLLSFSYQKQYPFLIIFNMLWFVLLTLDPFPNSILNFFHFVYFLTLPSLPKLLLMPSHFKLFEHIQRVMFQPQKHSVKCNFHQIADLQLIVPILLYRPHSWQWCFL